MTSEEFSNILSGLANAVKKDIDEDQDFDKRSQKHILERDSSYSELLRHFVDITKKRNESKERYKWIFFKIMMALLIVLNATIAITLVVLLKECNANQLISAVPVFITAIAGFVSSIIAIPLAITKYLFSTKEDEYITQIISHTQEHDLSGRKILKALENAANSKGKENKAS